jgi:DNA-binding CsgD family transcriptional regulator
MLSSGGAAKRRDDEVDELEATAQALLERVQGACDAVESLLDRIDTPAFVVDAVGAVAHANLQGRQLLACERGAVVVALAEAVTGFRTGRQDEKSKAWKVTPFPGRNNPGRALAILRSRTFTTQTRGPLRAARLHWQLTKRQVEVLDLVARGLTNELIADTLGIAKGTVEYHLSAVFDKAGVCNRATLIVRLQDLV